ncbi:MAG: NAD-binding protein [Archangiaceae bacterium]|nr:NAD-binding protein [Archangiaceae bacterium]
MADNAPKIDTPSTGDKVRYQVDRFLSWSPMARFVGLFGLSFLLITLNAVVVHYLMPVDTESASIDAVKELLATEGATMEPELKDALAQSLSDSTDGRILLHFLEPFGERGQQVVDQLTRPNRFGIFDGYWWATTRVFDAGTMGDDNQKGTIVALLAIFTTLCGVGVVALLIGLVSSTIGDKIEDLRKGKSPVIDEGHTLILGYGEKIFPILRELREANSNQAHAAIVILSPTEKEEVENTVRDRMGDMLTTRVVVRQGSPYSPHELRKVGAGRARSIIVLSADTNDEHEADSSGSADMGAIKVLLALRRVPGALTKNHAVVELMDSSRKSVVEELGAGGVEVVAMEETLSRLMVQTARQNGLAQVYRDLLTYEGSEFYFKCFPELAGQPFSVCQWRMKDAVVAGVRRPPREGQPAVTTLNPPEDFVLEAADELLVIAEDDDTFSLLPTGTVPQIPASFAGATSIARKPERLLVCGASPKLGDMIREFDNYVLPGSEAWLMPGQEKESFAEFIKAEVGALKNLKLKYVEGDPTLPEALKRVASPDFVCAMVVADTALAGEESDARTVITVLLLRSLFQQYTDKKPRIISEILDPRTKDLIERDYGADFVVSSEMTSMLLTQVSERRDLNTVFADLFDADGNEVYLKRAECYATLGEAITWLTVQKVARTRGEVAIGYLKGQANPLINPPQAESLTFTADDRVIVIAENDNEALGDQLGDAPRPAALDSVTDPAAIIAPTPSAPTPVVATTVAQLAAAQRQPMHKLGATPLVEKPPAASKPVTDGPRVAGPSTAPRPPLPTKKA